MNGSVAAYQSMAQMNGYDENKQRSAIQEYMKNGGVNLDPAVTAWCAGIVNAALAQQGIKGTGKLNARSFMEWGQGVDEPAKGDIAVFSRGDPNGWQGHVGFFDGYGDDGSIRVLGGNQSNAVNVSSYPADRLLGFRRPGENPAAVQNGPHAPQNTRAAVQSLSTRNSPQTEASPMEEEKIGGLLGSLFPNMSADRADRIRLGVSGLSMNPNEGLQRSIQQRMGERREDRKEAKGQAAAQQQANLTARWLAQQPGGEQIAQGIASGAFSGDQGLTMYRGVSQAQNNPNVQSSQMLPDMTGTVMTMRDGSVSVVTSGGETLSGQAAMDFIRNSNESYTNQQRDIYGARREGQLGADISLGGEAARVEAEGKQAPITAKEFGQQASLIRSSIGNMTDAISAIDRGANSGIVYKMLPAIGEASASLRNATNRLGLDVIGSVTFGALSLAEMQLAMETAVPQNLSPQDLREWLVRKQAAQQKAYQATMEAAQHFSSGGTQEEYYRMIGADQTRAATQPSNTSSGATHRFNPETGQVEPIR